MRPYGYKDDWEKFEKTRLSLKNAFWRKLNMKGISDQTMNILSRFGAE